MKNSLPNSRYDAQESATRRIFTLIELLVVTTC